MRKADYSAEQATCRGDSMNAVDSQIDKLLVASIGQHGFWLVNNLEYIEDDLSSGLVRYGLKGMQQRLNDYRSEYVKFLYKKIKAGRNN